MTLAAYMVNPPYKMDLPGLEQKAQLAREREFKLQEMPGQVDMENAKNANGTNREVDLSNYRARAMGGDKDAIDSLKGQPDAYAKVTEAFDAMTPDEWLEAQRTATAFGEAARRVSSFKAGSREQRQAWDEELGKLFKDGFIDKASHDQWVAQGPNDEIINEALDVGDFVKSRYDGIHRKGAALERARIEDIGTDNTRDDRKLDAAIVQGDTKADAATQNANSLEAYRTGKLKADITDDTADNNRDTADDQADNNRADRDLTRKIAEGKAKGSKGATTQGGEDDSGLGENEYGRRIRDIQKIIETRRRKDGIGDDEALALERELRKKYRIPIDAPSISGLDPAGGTGAGAGKKDDLGKPPAMKDRVIGKVYPSPKGPMEWTAQGWRPAVNG